MFNKKKKAVGIDFGTHFIKIVSLEYSDEKVLFDRYIIQKTPAHLIHAGAIQQPDNLGEILKSILEEHQLKPNHVSVSVPIGEETALIKLTDVPNLKPKEMAKAVQSMLEEEFRHSPNELYHNWLKLSSSNENGKDTANIMIVGVLKTAMDNLVQTLKVSKLKPYYSEVDFFSNLRALYSKQQGNKNINVGIVDIGANETVIGFIQDGNFKYIRNIPLAGYELITRITDYQGLDTKGAEEQLFNYGAISSNPRELSFEKQVVCESITEPVEMILEEVRMTMDFYQEHYRGTIDKMIFVGGGSRIKGIDQFSSSILNVPCEIGIPEISNKIELSRREELKDVWPSLMVALGLALKEVEDNV